MSKFGTMVMGPAGAGKVRNDPATVAQLFQADLRLDIDSMLIELSVQNTL